ncbi:DUF3952 domain-containing protein [Bacillus cytotoxicus]|uniref:DUF3952 domain-containing protein n=1 Tax=Bacillus cytotoxicus TaxID=580165 RepID=UPI0008644759|nr:DUF3952 domain-containing protein [Bacillus cytotoxicus]AWC28506.1 DUF3952 domain-containing protein [Bacillus cytotoxicus]AWC40110.1 DUF3952 domain-containing protein [Bacillus cytotoxicus]AWC48041.1 DUF3952 domain-containing protein [Bacillus cytotoxicus]AWC52574.1 DUF3952 domain-containing protein [Bacillus cytotoxicus]AWC56706.1 DUF3952 domain-containing protein [Bacillus cytotoxicus]
MKVKKKVKGMIVMTIVVSLLGGCGSSKPEALKGTKIEYERLIKALDEGDMKTVMSASDDGYAHVEEQSIQSVMEEKEDGTHTKRLYQSTDGIYFWEERNIYGTTKQTTTNLIENANKAHKDDDYKKEEVYSTNFIYKNGQVQSSNQNLDILPVKFIIDRLQGIGKLKPEDARKGFDEPNRISYSLTESQFQQIINDKLHLQYDKFGTASIVIYFNRAKDLKEKPMEIDELKISVDYEKKNDQGKMVTHIQQILVGFDDKEENTRNAKTKYLEYKNQFNSSK